MNRTKRGEMSIENLRTSDDSAAPRDAFQVTAVAQRAGVKRLVLTHLLAQIDHPRIREQIVHEIQKEFTGKVVWGEDLMELTFAGATIANIERY